VRGWSSLGWYPAGESRDRADLFVVSRVDTIAKESSEVLLAKHDHVAERELFTDTGATGA
jgi:hypothetical protein